MEAADLFVVNKADRSGADKLRQEIEVMLGIRRGNAFRHVAPHHRPSAPPPDRADGGGRRRAGADQTLKDAWEPPVLATVAVQGQGVDAVVAALDRHHAYLEASGRLEVRRRERLADRTRGAVERSLRQWLWTETPAAELLAQRLDDVTAGRRSPYDVAAEILDQVRTGVAR
jgi:LAO/AO transport system kinase